MVTLLVTVAGLAALFTVSTCLVVVLITRAPRIEDCRCSNRCRQFTEFDPRVSEGPSEEFAPAPPPEPAYQKRA